MIMHVNQARKRWTDSDEANYRVSERRFNGMFSGDSESNDFGNRRPEYSLHLKFVIAKAKC